MSEFTTASQLAMSLAENEARFQSSAHVDSEHLFLGILKLSDLPRGNLAGTLPAGSLEEVNTEISALWSTLARIRLDPVKGRRRLRAFLRDAAGRPEGFSGSRSARFIEACAIAGERASRRNASRIALDHLLVACLSQHSDHITRLLRESAIDRDTVLAGLDAPSSPAPLLTPDMPSMVEQSVLSEYGRNLTRLAANGKLDPVFGRKEEIRAVAQVLLQRKKNNPLLVGEPGVGKTVIVEGLAQLLVGDSVPPVLKGTRIFELSLPSLLAGTKYRGDFEERLETIMREVAADPRMVVFLDEIHTVVGSGSGGGAMDAANILKPALARGDFRCIGATTVTEYRAYIEKDPALERRFQTVWIEEPTVEATDEILEGLRPTLESFYALKIEPETLRQAVRWSVRYLPDFRLPDKAIDLIDQACTRKVLGTFSGAPANPDRTLMADDIAAMLSRRCRIPLEKLTGSEAERLGRMEEVLGKRVKGQEGAIRTVAEVVRASRLGLRNENRPAGVFLFAGATGIGKTELAKAMAEFLFDDDENLLRFDMSEYAERHSVAKLIGAPPGYVGHEAEGQLTRRARSRPYSVILFDEIEKAHPEILDIFLQMLDDGRLTDSHGRRVDFREAFVVFTTNLGSVRETGRGRPIGVSVGSPGTDSEPSERWKEYETRIRAAIAAHLRPELLNRIQNQVVFYPLDRTTIAAILDKLLEQLMRQMTVKRIELEVSAEAREFLVQSGYNETYGARELERTIDKQLASPIAGMLLSGELRAGNRVRVHLDGGGAGLRFETAAAGPDVGMQPAREPTEEQRG